MQESWDGEAFIKEFMQVWNAHDVEGIMRSMTDAKRSYRKSTL